MKASVIVPSWNGVDYLEGCLGAVLSQNYPDFEIIVVDNGSTDGSAELVTRQFSAVRLIRSERNRGFSVAANTGLAAATGELLVLLNQDTVVQEGWLAALAATLGDPAIGMVGCKLYYPDGTIQHAGGYLHGRRGETAHLGRRERDEGQYDQLADADFVTGAAIAVTRTSLARIGPLDEGFALAYYEDVDWCYRARKAGLRVVYVPQARVVHYESTSTDSVSYGRKCAWHRGRLRFLFRHRPVEWLAHQFVPAESSWIAVMPDRNEELMAVRSAYLSTTLNLAGILSFRRSSEEEADALVGLLTDLRSVATVGLGTLQKESALAAVPYELPPAAPEAPRHVPEAAEPIGDGSDVMDGSERKGEAEREQGLSSAVTGEAEQEIETQLLSVLEERHGLREHAFSSRVPVIGGLINAFRRFWGSVSAQWYARSIIQQQSAFNAALVAYLKVLQERVDQASPGLRYQQELVAWLGRRTDRLEATTTTQGHLMKGQLRDMAETLREITALAEHLAHLESGDCEDGAAEKRVRLSGRE